MFNKLKLVWKQETGGFKLRLLLARLVLSFLPVYVGGRIRPFVLRAAGFRIGKGTVMVGLPTIQGVGDIYSRLQIGPNCFFNTGCHLDLSHHILIGGRVSFGQSVMVLTHSHKIGGPEQRAAELAAGQVTIQDGVWLGARSLILPGVTIGRGAVVAAGAVVAQDVRENTLVGGVPAKEIRQLE